MLHLSQSEDKRISRDFFSLLLPINIFVWGGVKVVVGEGGGGVLMNTNYMFSCRNK